MMGILGPGIKRACMVGRGSKLSGSGDGGIFRKGVNYLFTALAICGARPVSGSLNGRPIGEIATEGV